MATKPKLNITQQKIPLALHQRDFIFYQLNYLHTKLA